MLRWQQFEKYLAELVGSGLDRFSQATVREDLGLNGVDASNLIRAYLVAQRAIRSETKFVLHRTGRTTATIWTIGVKSADARQVTGQFMGDFRLRLEAAVEPDLRRIAEINPRAGRLVERAIDVMFAQIETTVAVLTASNAIDESEHELVPV